MSDSYYTPELELGYAQAFALTTEQQFRLTVITRELNELKLEQRSDSSNIRDLRKILVGQSRQIMIKDNFLNVYFKRDLRRKCRQENQENTGAAPKNNLPFRLSTEQEFKLLTIGQNFDDLVQGELSLSKLEVIKNLLLRQCEQSMIKDNLIAFFAKKAG